MGKDKDRPKSENEAIAVGLAEEMKSKFGVFDLVITKLVLDDAGIDILLVKFFGKRGKHFRFHVQHKSSQIGAKAFERMNPCIPVWIVNKKITGLLAQITLLEIIVEKTSERQSPHLRFFQEKLEELKGLLNFIPPA